MTPAHHAILRVAEVARAESPRKRAPLSPAMRSALDDALNAVQRQHCTAVKAAHTLLGRVCGFCGSREYNCPCRDNDESAASAADGGYRHATAGQPPAPAALKAGREVVGPPRAPAADGEGAFARTEPATVPQDEGRALRAAATRKGSSHVSYASEPPPSNSSRLAPSDEGGSTPKWTTPATPNHNEAKPRPAAVKLTGANPKAPATHSAGCP